MKMQVGNINSDERDEILTLYKLKCSLEELLLVNELDRVLVLEVRKDLEDTNKLYKEWWDKTSQKYNWKGVSGKTWTVDFETCNVFLDLN